MNGLTPSQVTKKPPDKKPPGENKNKNNNNQASSSNNNHNNNNAKSDNSGNANNNNNSNKGKNNNRNRRRRNGKKANSNSKPAAATEETQKTGDANTASNSGTETGKSNQNSNNGRKQRQRQRQRQRGKKVNENGDTNNDNADKSVDNNGVDNNKPQQQQQPQQQAKKKKKRPPKKKFPWRKHIPEGTVDPITLDNLDTLTYPPFALCADEPYIPVPVWPVPQEKEEQGNNNNNTANNNNNNTNPETLNRQRLADQWGEFMLPDENKPKNDDKPKTTPTIPLSKRPLNLFDGRALAFYMVSQLQFIDPFTRRDLTRAELLNLDDYLEKHGSASIDGNQRGRNNNKKQSQTKQQKIKVTDAYDAKGITLSSAGAAAATAQGRADIMQQTAQQLLNSLFVGQASVSAAPTPQPTSLQEQYAAMQQQEQASAQQRREQQQQQQLQQQAGVLQSNDHGFMIIDDDENPELRGRGHNDFPSLAEAAPAPTPMYSASHIAGRYGNRPATTTQAGAFPALPRSQQQQQAKASAAAAQTKPKKSKTLSKISGIVKKTTAQEKQKQWEAREAARRKAMLSNLTFGMNPVASKNPSQSLLAPPTAMATSVATEEQLQRNRAFADALGVKPAPQRHYVSGWARPTDESNVAANAVNELEVALYPDDLIQSAKDHSTEVLVKLERRWKRFLADDKAASLPLNKMHRSLRKLVHHYAEFWHLKTESFDPEPNRYIHCVKLAETRMPHPLLSDVARNWRGPALPDATRTLASVMNLETNPSSSVQTAGQKSFEPRSALAMSSSKGDLVAFEAASTATMNSRSEVLMDKQRPQLKLLPRTVPLELPPMEEHSTTNSLNLEEDMRMTQVRLEEKRRKEREIELRKKQALEDAFCSDDESESVGNKAAGFSDSDWEDEDQEALFDGSDEEEL